MLPSSRRKDNTNPTLLPPYPELPPTFWEQHGSVVVVGGILVLLAVAALIWWCRRPKLVTPVPLEVEVRQALDALQGKPEHGAMLSEVSQILRRYFARAFGMPGGEFTTTEFCRLLGGNAALDAELSSALATFLETCDHRKFAPTPPTAPLHAVAQARELFERAEARRAQLAAVPTQAAA